MKVIKKKTDAQAFVAALKRGSVGDEDINGDIVFRFHDPYLSYHLRGWTKIGYCKQRDSFWNFSAGVGWSDQSLTWLGNEEKAIDWVWRNRKPINAALHTV